MARGHRPFAGVRRIDGLVGTVRPARRAGSLCPARPARRLTARSGATGPPRARLEVLPLGTRLMVGQQILDLYVGVRLLRPQPNAGYPPQPWRLPISLLPAS